MVRFVAAALVALALSGFSGCAHSRGASESEGLSFPTVEKWWK